MGAISIRIANWLSRWRRVRTWLGWALRAIPFLCCCAWPFVSQDAKMRDSLIFILLIYIASMFTRISIEIDDDDDGERDDIPDETAEQKPVETVRPVLRVVGK